MTQFTFRKATEGDFHRLLDIRNQVMKEYVVQVRGWDEAREEARFRGNFDADNTQVIMSNDRVAGFLGVRDKNDHLYIAQVYILPEYQGRGTGTALIREVLRRGLPVELWVMTSNTGALRLYERLGFRVMEEDDDHYLMRAEPGNNTRGPGT